MRPLRSALYQGRVRHTRLQPFHHDFEYRVFYGLFDIDELDYLDRGLRLFSVGRRNLASFYPQDHGPVDGSSLRAWAEDVLAEAGVDIDGGRIELLAFPRILGYAFNPLSVWYCYGSEGDLKGVLHEVRNTFGDRHVYVVPVNDETAYRHSFAKAMHVSPFNPMEQTYHFTVNRPGKRLQVAIEQTDESGKVFRAGMRLSRIPLTDRNLLRVFFTHPLVTMKVIAGIHWQALRLWLKGATYRKRPRPPADSITIVDPSMVG